MAAEKAKQKEVVGRQEAVKKQSRKKWTDRRQLRNKVERSGHIVAAEKTKQKEVVGRQKADRDGLLGV